MSLGERAGAGWPAAERMTSIASRTGPTTSTALSYWRSSFGSGPMWITVRGGAPVPVELDGVEADHEHEVESSMYSYSLAVPSISIVPRKSGWSSRNTPFAFGLTMTGTPQSSAR